MIAAARRLPLSRRLVAALILSIAVHLWLAGEVPVGASRPAAASARPVMTVRIEPGRVPRAVPPAPEGEVAVRPAQSRRTTAEPAAPAVAVATPTLLPFADPTYYPARQLDVYPALLAPLAPAYPPRALDEGRSGHVLVLVLIDAAGRVDEVSVVEAEPRDYFEEAAKQTFANAQFSPARRNGLPVKSRVLIQLDFDPTSVRR